MIKVLAIVGARPNMPKVATIQRAFKLPPLRDMAVQLEIAHTGQHSDPAMSSALTSALDLQLSSSSPVSSSSDADAIAKLMVNVDNLLIKHQPHLVLVFGDVNSTVAAAVVAARNDLPVVHIEAGLRSGVFEPEEINRKLITAATQYHLTPSKRAGLNLRREGIPAQRIYFIGNTLTETFLLEAARRQQSTVLEQVGVKAGGYILLTIHKPVTMSNVPWLRDFIGALSRLEQVVWVLHPQTQQRLQKVAPELLHIPSFIYSQPLAYHDFGKLIESARCFVMDSAGGSEEATMAGVPTVTVGVESARPETILEGTNVYAGFDIPKCLEAIRDGRSNASIPAKWDDQVSSRASQALASILTHLEFSGSSRAHWRLREPSTQDSAPNPTPPKPRPQK